MIQPSEVTSVLLQSEFFSVTEDDSAHAPAESHEAPEVVDMPDEFFQYFQIDKQVA